MIFKFIRKIFLLSSLFWKLLLDKLHAKPTLFGGIAAFTRQRTSRALSAKRKKLGDEIIKKSPELYVNTKNLLENMAYDCVDGEPPAAAAKLRSGILFH